MPTFTAITLGRLLEPGSRNPTPTPPSAPVQVERAVPNPFEKKSILRPPASPALYATPEATPPLPDSPSSFPPSPYIINHKRRGPRLLKSCPQHIDAGFQSEHDSRKAKIVNGQQGEQVTSGLHDEKNRMENGANGYQHKTPGNCSSDDGMEKLDKSENPVVTEPERDVDSEGFFDPQDSMSTLSNTEFDDSNGLERSWKPSTPLGEYFDAFEEIASEGTPSTCRNIEEELNDLRLNLSMEVERRMRAELALENLQRQWQQLSDHLSLVGLTLPAPRAITEKEGQSLDPAGELCQQVIVTRAVATSVGRGCSRAEIELKMESFIESKNFEITRLSDRLQYYEAANREMSQRNQEAVEMVRQKRQKRKRRQKWLWGSVGLAITLGAASLVWSYFPSFKPSSPSEGDEVNRGH